MAETKRALITGIIGVVGSHLSEYLLSNEFEAYGTKRWRSKTDSLAHLTEKLCLSETDLKDKHSLVEAIKKSEPDYIFHLAAQSFVPTSWRAPTYK